MRQLYLDRRDTRLDVESGRLLIHYPQVRQVTSLPLSQLDAVILLAHTELSSRVLQQLNQNGIRLVILAGRGAQAIALTEPYRHGHAQRRIQQYALSLDERWQLQAARRLLQAKLQAQGQQLYRWQRQRPEYSRPLHKARQQIADLRLGLLTAPDRASLLGLEGAASAAYFKAMVAIAPTALGFAGRRRQPPPDPVNALLSLSYTLLHCEALKMLASAGLDPSLGFLHRPAWGRESLACDLIELFRCRIDAWVLKLLYHQELRSEHFSLTPEGACLLTKVGRQHFYPAWEHQARSLRQGLRRLSQAWANELLHTPSLLPDGLALS